MYLNRPNLTHDQKIEATSSQCFFFQLSFSLTAFSGRILEWQVLQKKVEVAGIEPKTSLF